MCWETSDEGMLPSGPSSSGNIEQGRCETALCLRGRNVMGRDTPIGPSRHLGNCSFWSEADI